MSALTRPPSTRTEPELVLEWPGLSQPASRGRALAVSLLLHAIGLAVLVLLARSDAILPLNPGQTVHSSTTLVAPPIGFTQTSPNHAQVGKEFSLDNLVPRAPLRAPAAVPSHQPVALPLPPPPELPKAVAKAEGPPAPQLGSTQIPGPPPQIQTEENPKMVFETPGVPSGLPRTGGQELGLSKSPGQLIAEAARARPSAPSDVPHSGLQVSDSDLAPAPNFITRNGMQQAPAAPPARHAALELLSDPQGVDFKPYLIRILATVKRNWQAIIPETARLGRQGRVQIQFIISRSGTVPKLVIAVPSGTESLDLAAVAGIDSSQPFPALPPEFKGTDLRLQFTFTYNMR